MLSRGRIARKPHRAYDADQSRLTVALRAALDGLVVDEVIEKRCAARTERTFESFVDERGQQLERFFLAAAHRISPSM
ncbi:hypothetical protein G9444_1379 [Rhodococcus erythropolis]|uniref:Uncharacterized protein n=1 Tax=Rhodococcus erythropolis TaxID=1833 RepID=A0A6G9CNK9_RHOER|nr:hypothetical protein G9444_1379 [Rhodococcus erythropolis]